jgi:hypothetical protein
MSPDRIREPDRQVKRPATDLAEELRSNPIQPRCSATRITQI